MTVQFWRNLGYLLCLVGLWLGVRTMDGNALSLRYETVAQVALLGGLHQFNKYFLYPCGAFFALRIKSKPPADADAMGICHDGGETEQIAAQEIGDLASDTGEAEQIVHFVWHFAAVFGQQHA